MTTDEALLTADGHGGDAAQALRVLAVEVRRLHALLDDAEVIAHNPLRPGGACEWVDLGLWINPGDRVIVMDEG